MSLQTDQDQYHKLTNMTFLRGSSHKGFVLWTPLRLFFLTISETSMSSLNNLISALNSYVLLQNVTHAPDHNLRLAFCYYEWSSVFFMLHEPVSLKGLIQQPSLLK